MLVIFLFFFFNDTATTEIYTLSLHDALPISVGVGALPAIVVDDTAVYFRIDRGCPEPEAVTAAVYNHVDELDRKSTRLNSSHGYISYAVFCLKKKTS